MTRTNTKAGIRSTASGKRKIALALQGGGSHGAYTWGLLDRLLEENTFEIIGVTGTSAGAMNAVVLVDGLLRGGPAEARKRLRLFWEAVGKMPGFGSMLWPLSGEAAADVKIDQTAPYLLFDMARRNMSPYDLNPSNINPLRAPLTELVDYERIRSQDDIKILICATNVRTSRRRGFTNETISVDATLASACLPDLFPAVEIDGEPYWDGGYTGNPAFTGLLRQLPKCDLIIVRIDPVYRGQLPRTVGAIHDRMIEVSFNSTFWLELSALAVLLQLVEEGQLDRERFGRINFHGIEAHEDLEKLPLSSKLNNYPAFLEHLFNLGRKAADVWLTKHGAAVGERSTLDLKSLLSAEFLEAGPYGRTADTASAG